MVKTIRTGIFSRPCFSCCPKRNRLQWRNDGRRNMSRLVLLRHGESLWNKENRFTGWTDVPLTARGVDEAHRAGRQLAREGFRFDCAHTSVLRRAIDTLWIVLDELDQLWLPTYNDYRLNERHYGALQGLNKEETAALIGKKQVFQWRRTYTGCPPLLEENDPRHPRFDIRYRGLDPRLLPAGESLLQTYERMLPWWKNAAIPVLQQYQDLLVVAHSNSLRALMKQLDGVSDADFPRLVVPTGVPILYEIDGETMRIVEKRELAV